ncbi:MAG: DEAD/DEAH box helicase, partial [Selenomonadaceae bacterium]|nr:DEAD/DEAH box helicase [Selenomonadaceae bacterium]
MTIDELLEKYRAEESSTHGLGTKFERLMKNFMLTYPAWRGKFSDVWLWNEFPFREELGGIDLGVDLVAKTVDGDFWAVQCKFYAETTIIDKTVVDTFISTSGKTFGGQNFSARIWISTSDNFTDNAEKTLQNQTPPVTRINLENLREAEIDWEKLDAGKFGEEVLTKKFLRDYQSTAVAGAHKYFQTHNRGKLIMACGTGKTFTSLKIAENLAPDGLILFLVPSITLIKQTLVEWARNSEKPFNAVCVCSDKTAANKNDDDIREVNLPLPPTTDPKNISDAITLPRRENFGMTVIFSTYQSLEKVSEAQKTFRADFDLVICDEAHRTTGSSKDDATQFTAIHDENFIRAKRRMYMTATPRMYNSDAKIKADENDITLWSMDDKNIYGKEFYRLDFGEAVDKNLLADYKVIVLTVNEKISADKKSSADDIAKIDGCINALSKKMIDISSKLAEVDPAPMHTAVAFCPTITASKIVSKTFNALAESKKDLLEVHAEHVDGTMSGIKREKNLRWLKSVPAEGNSCRILTNVRCLSEGVDVPALDAVIFMSSKKSKVEIVQAVGRVMRKAQNKKYGYIIIPVVVPLEKNPEDVLQNSAKYGVIWEILNALRAHDKRVDIFIEEIKLNGKSEHIDITKPDIGGEDEDEDEEKIYQTVLDFGAWKDFLYARMVERVGNRRYWEQWANDIADIADRHIKRINELISVPGSEARRAFGNFVLNLQQNLNPAVTSKQAIEMIAQHIVSRPVFEAIFDNYSFVKNNPVSQSLEKVLAALDTHDTDDDSERLQKFFDSVRRRCEIATTAEQKQTIIVDLYEKFFKVATPKTVDKLGIVYTPVEVVDFILRSVDAVLKKHFKRSLTDKNVHIIDPFAGTGTFITRLIQSGLIRPKNLFNKYLNELHANEIVLLAYYIAAINIENAFATAWRDQKIIRLKDQQLDDAQHSFDLLISSSYDLYTPFEGICFTDTFQLYEREQVLPLESFLRENSARVNEQKKARIEVIVGNPPYSVGQKSANDNNQNQTYFKLEERIEHTYAKLTNATNKNSLYDSYIKAFRWASDRISDGGVIGFVTNAGWLDGAAMDGLRKCFAKDFSAIYVFNLRGNARTQGELRRKESGNVFGGGSRAPIAITILVKTTDHAGDAEIFYRDIGDYLTREEKLLRIKNTPDVFADDFTQIFPNERGDWINQRGDTFDNFIALTPEKKFDGAAKSFFVTYSNGLKTQRDAWCYNFSRTNLLKNAERTINAFNAADDWDFYLSKDIVWTRATKTKKIQGHRMIYSSRRCVEAIYRPFCKEYLYYDTGLNEMIYQIDKLFPN